MLKKSSSSQGEKKRKTKLVTEGGKKVGRTQANPEKRLKAGGRIKGTRLSQHFNKMKKPEKKSA